MVTHPSPLHGLSVALFLQFCPVLLGFLQMRQMSSFSKLGGLFCALIAPCPVWSLRCPLRAVRNISADLTTSSRSASFLSHRYADRWGRFASRNITLSRASYVCGASANFNPSFQVSLEAAKKHSGISPSSDEQVRNRYL